MVGFKTRNSRRSLIAASHRMGVLDLIQRMERAADAPLYILAYHRVDEPAAQPYLDPSLLSATPAQFQQQMRYISEHYHPVSAEEVIAAASGGAPLPADAVLVTVDDGYCDFQSHIFPAAHQYGIRPVLFVPTAFVGAGTFWWDEVYRAVQFAPAAEIATPLGALRVDTPDGKRQALEQLRAHIKRSTPDAVEAALEQLRAQIPPPIRRRGRATLTWDELRALDRAGATIAAHTHTHPILSRISPEDARREVRTSQDAIAREIGHALPIFAFPDGKPEAFNDAVMTVLREEGFKVVVTMNEGRAHLNRDNLLCLPRLGMSARMSLAQFHLHLTPAYARFKGRLHG